MPDVVVRLAFLREELLYDIRNIAYIEADVMGEPGGEGGGVARHAQHVLADVGERGNVDRVGRLLSVAHAEVLEMLYPFTKAGAVGGVMDDRLEEPAEYVVEMRVPGGMSQTTVGLLSRQVHEYMVCRVLADWLSMTRPAASGAWRARAQEAAAGVERAKHARLGPQVRKMHPW